MYTSAPCRTAILTDSTPFPCECSHNQSPEPWGYGRGSTGTSSGVFTGVKCKM